MLESLSVAIKGGCLADNLSDENGATIEIP
jgi:hypothetical protein